MSRKPLVRGAGETGEVRILLGEHLASPTELKTPTVRTSPHQVWREMCGTPRGSQTKDSGPARALASDLHG